MKAPSFDYVMYDMTWAEFQLRLFAYNRMRKAEQADLREVAYAALQSAYVWTKDKPPSKERFWPIYGENKSKLPSTAKTAFAKAFLAYQKQKDEREAKG